MTYDEILPLIRRDKFVPLRVVLKDGRSFDLRRFGQFSVVSYEITVRLPYELPNTPVHTRLVRIEYPDIKEVVEMPEMAQKEPQGSTV